MKYFFLFIILLSLQLATTAQTYTIRGVVLDDDTGEGLSFCSVFFKGTKQGVTTDVDGIFEIKTSILYDTLCANYVGYTTGCQALKDTAEQEIRFRMISSTSTLDEVVILAGENPANAIVRNIIRHKDENRLSYYGNYRCEDYVKVELDFIDISEKLQQSKLLRPFDFVFQNIDSISDEKPFLPVYVTETISDRIAIKEQGKPRIVPKALRTSGAQNQSFVDMLNRVNETIDIYDDWYLIMEKSFASPFSNTGLQNYEYYILDSTYIDGKFCWNLKYKPKRRQESTFYGDFWVADTTFAIVRVNMRKSPDVNVNLVNRIIIYNESVRHTDSTWLPAKQKIIVDFKVSENTPGVILRRTATTRDYQLHTELTDETPPLKSKTPPTLNELNRNEDYWTNARHEALTNTEAAVYQMVDSIKNVPAFKTWYDILSTLTVGYKELGKIEIGTWYSIYSSNPVEGHRFRLGTWTSNKFSKWVRFGGYAAYGLEDQRLKYGGDLQWNIRKNPRIIFGAAYKNDISGDSENSESLASSSVLTGFYRRDVPFKQIAVEEMKLFYERNWPGGWRFRATVLHRILDPYDHVLENGGGFHYQYMSDPEQLTLTDTTINSTELILKFRYAKEEKFISGEFFQTSLGSKYPIIELQYMLGMHGLMGSDYDYQRVDLNYHHWFYLNPMGWFNYWIEAGATFGQVPFLLAKVHAGNETLSYDPNAYNAMNQYEFASDAYIGVKAVHHFEGFFLNKIPLLRKLEWREVAFFRGVLGRMSERNLQANGLMLFDPTQTDTYSGFRAPSARPYMEAGVGIENIFKVIRIDAVWRLSYNDNPQAPKFGVRGGLSFYF
jgi:hypothetical protein